MSHVTGMLDFAAFEKEADAPQNEDEQLKKPSISQPTSTQTPILNRQFSEVDFVTAPLNMPMLEPKTVGFAEQDFVTAPLNWTVLEPMTTAPTEKGFVTAPLYAPDDPPTKNQQQPQPQLQTLKKETATNDSTNELMMDAMEEEPSEILWACTSELEEVPSANQHTLLGMISLMAPCYRPVGRAPISIVAAVDRSGSMAGSKLTLTRQTLKFVVSQLDSSDRFGIVTYDHTVKTALSICTMDVQGKSTALKVIDGIDEGGSTNLSGGLCQAIREIQRQLNHNDVASVLLLTDGLPNVGTTSSSGIIREMRAAGNGIPPSVAGNQRDSVSSGSASSNDSSGLAWTTASISSLKLSEDASSGSNSSSSTSSSLSSGLACTVNTFGFGSDHNPTLLRDIAEAGNGVYYFVEKDTDIPTLFADCVGGLLSVCAQNISIKIEAANGATIKKVHGKHNRTALGNNGFELKIGDIQSEESKDILFSVELPALPNPLNEGEEFIFANISFSYFNVINGKTSSGHLRGTVRRPQHPSKQQQINFTIDRQRNRILAAEAMEMASQMANSGGNLKRARSLIKSCMKTIQTSVSAKDEFCVGLLKDLERALEGMADQQSWSTSGNMQVQAQVSSHNNQRSTGSLSSDWYTTSSRKEVTGNLDFNFS